MPPLQRRWLPLYALTTVATLGVAGWALREALPVQAKETSIERFDPDVVRPTPGSRLAHLLEAHRDADKETLRAVSMAALASATPDEEPYVRWIAAHAARGDALDEAASLLLPLAVSDHPLAAWAKLHAAEWLEARDPGRALALLDALLVPSSELETFPGKSAGERMRARVLAQLGRRDEAIRAFEAMITDSGDDSAALQVLMPLADLLAAGSGGEITRAVALYDEVAIRVPETRLGKRADEAATALRARLSPEQLKEVPKRGAEVALTRAEALLKGRQYKQAKAAFLALEKKLRDRPELLCRARFGRAKALLDSRARAEGAALMSEVAERCPDDRDRRAWARYHAGRAYSALGKNAEAIAQYEALERESPDHSLADDALFRAAKVARDNGDDEGVRTRLTELPRRYPSGDMQLRARFALALHEASQGRYAAAVDTLSQDLRDDPIEGLAGRASYFRARFLGEMGRTPEAADGYALTVSRYPLSYYGMLALSRLEELDPPRAAALTPKLPVSGGDERLWFEMAPELRSPGFQRAVALLRVGDAQLSMTELRSLGFLDRNAPPEQCFVAAAMLDRGGAPHLAMSLVRSRMAALLGRAPVGRALSLIRLVYPYAYSPLIEDFAQRESVPPAFVRAVAREESGFYPAAVSPAGAHGLVQLLQSTARAVSKGGLGLPTTPSALHEPRINLALGARFMAHLASTLRGHWALVPAAYNAGPAAAARWLEERADQPTDLWIEQIPYDETRTYSRRVLQTYGIYHWLQTGRPLKLAQTLPGKAEPEPQPAVSPHPELSAGL